ncbi:MAG: FAD-binding protein [Lewinellaceae bacterium]|nr:FAD-binding protein [Lewinellaceae bacterium]
MSLEYKTNQSKTVWSGQLTEYPEKEAIATDLEDLVRIVTDAEAEALGVKPFGSLWSFTDIALSRDVMVDMRKFNRVLSFKKPFDGQENPPFIESIMQSERQFIHFEAGMTMKELVRTLTGSRAAMPTAGGGADGQTIGGMLGTASHGSYLNRGTLANWIRAIHLIGPGGQQFWIEKSAPHHLTTDETLRNVQGWSEDLKPVRDDDLFNAVVASFGRIGIIYSLVLEVVEHYHLRSKRIIRNWDDLQANFLGRGIDVLVREMERGLGFNNGLFLLDMTTLLDDQSPHCFIEGREIISDDTLVPKNDPSSFIRNDVFWHHSDWWGILNGDPAEIGHRMNGAPEYRIKEITEYVFGVFFREDEHQGPWWYVMWGGDPGIRVHSANYAFDAQRPDFIRFAQEVRRLGRQPYTPGNLTLRFQRKTPVFLATQRYEETVHIEIAAPVGYGPSESFMSNVDRLAREYNGVPHWGQEHSISSKEVRSIYGKDYRKWIKALRSLSRYGRIRTFSNNFTRARGLEPYTMDSLLFMST